MRGGCAPVLGDWRTDPQRMCGFVEDSDETAIPLHISAVLGRLLARSFVRSFACFVALGLVRLFDRSLAESLLDLFACSFVWSLARALPRLFVFAFARSLVRPATW